jgi:hypothetical protein
LRIDGQHLPERLSGFGIKRYKSTVKRADIDFALVDGDSSIDYVAASSLAIGALNIGVPFP